MSPARVLPLCLAVFSTCSTPPPSRLVKAQVIGAARGGIITVTASESAKLAGTSLDVPAGALAMDTRITLERSDDIVPVEDVAGPAGTWGPAGRRFTKPVSTVHRRLFKTIDDGPWLTFAFDQGNTLARVPMSELERRTLAELETEALANLAKRNFTITRTGAAAQLVDEYAPEALLLPSVCAELCRVVGEPLCLVAAREGMLEVAEKMFREASGRRLAPMPLTISAEAVQGFAAGVPAGAEPASGSKPWWRFW